jgi:hypothetical protein
MHVCLEYCRILAMLLCTISIHTCTSSFICLRPLQEPLVFDFVRQRSSYFCQELTWEILCRLCATSFTILSSYCSIRHYMFRPNRPSSGVQVVMAKNSAAHCNAVFFPPVVLAFGYIGCVGYHQFN